MKLDSKFLERVTPAINRTWQAIGYDVEEVVGDDNEQAIELCIDANRLKINGEDELADQLVGSACKVHGYPKVLKFLSKNIWLV